MRRPALLSRPLALRLLAWGALVVGMFGCVDAAPLSASEPSVTRTWPRPAEELRAHEPVSTEAVIVVVLDGARWQDVLVGVDPSLGASLPASQIVTADRLMPNLHAMIARGALVGGPDQGMPMVASGPNYVSLPGYNEIFSGRFPARCQDNECPQTRDATLADLAPDAAVFSSWGPIARAASSVAASGPAGLFVSTGQPSGEFRADRDTATAALAHLAEHRPTFLFLGLGEPDELAHRGDYPGYLDALRGDDAILGDVEVALEGLGERGHRTSVFVTCDHGRGADFRDHGAAWPESSRVWLVAAGGRIPALGAVPSFAIHRLADIAPTARGLLDLPADRSPRAGTAIAELLGEDTLDPREAHR